MKRLFHVMAGLALLAGGSVAVVAAAELSAGSKALVAANAAMHQAMAVEMTGDVDVDFMRTMIPHHEGAVEMAKIVIENGKDPEVRKLAEEIIKAQETEITFMKAWLEKNGAGEGAGAPAVDHGAH
jgi:uncharacterized protein (DUF305 family)